MKRRKRRLVFTTGATRCDASRVTRIGQNVVGCQDRWGGINGASIELYTTQAVRFGSVRFCSAGLGLQREWRLRRLANPRMARHVFNAFLTERDVTRVIRRKRRSVFTTRATRRDASRATRSGQNWVGCQDRWRGIKGASVELRTTQVVRFGSVLFGWSRLAVWMTPKASGQSPHDTSCI